MCHQDMRMVIPGMTTHRERQRIDSLMHGQHAAWNGPGFTLGGGLWSACRAHAAAGEGDVVLSVVPRCVLLFVLAVEQRLQQHCDLGLAFLVVIHVLLLCGCSCSQTAFWLPGNSRRIPVSG
jgi:hypothetical protein